MLKRTLCWTAIALLAALGFVAAMYLIEMRRAYQRVSGRSKVIASPYGEIEYTEGGSGPPVLVIHGSGGGYDQGELMVQAVLNDEFHWIAPSRFGYLGSSLPDGATFDEQANAYAHLLDRLGIDRVAVVALSHGGPSALLFAALHPERATSLTLLSCGVASSSAQDQEEANRKGTALMTIFRYDLLYWSISRLFRGRLLDLMGVDERVISGLTPRQRALADQVIDFMNPVSLRSKGAAFDNRAAMPNERISAIKAPTQIFHATDDSLQLFRNAEFAGANIPGAKLHRYERGGHLLMIVEQERIRPLVQKFIRDNMR
ncbi:MAG: alpha/beta fold hydrolase [Blastocatellales bacterium]